MLRRLPVVVAVRDEVAGLLPLTENSESCVNDNTRNKRLCYHLGNMSRDDTLWLT